METLGDRIRGVRAMKKISQFELADRLKVHTSTISRWESGERGPNVTDLIAIATALNTTVAYLLGETDDPAPGGGASMTAPLVNASSATVNAPIAAGHDHVIATTTPQIITPDFSSIPQLAMQMKKQGNIAEMKDAIDLLESSLSMLRRAVQESAPANAAV